MVYERNGCASKGSLDIYVEPFVPAPDLVILGEGPVARALHAIARGFDFRLADDLPSPDIPRPPRDLFVVVATQGRGDAAALERAAASGARFVAFVGSARKAATLKDKLAEKGADRAALDRIAAPAGLPIGAATAEEIALSILAQIVQDRRTRGAT
jgi:xanthine dehydrogenase accessory factor